MSLFKNFYSLFKKLIKKIFFCLRLEDSKEKGDIFRVNAIFLLYENHQTTLKKKKQFFFKMMNKEQKFHRFLHFITD